MAIQFLNTVAVDTNVLYVDTSSDRVGIGETSPDRLLHLKSSLPAVRLEDSDVSGLYHEFFASTSGLFQFKADGGNVQANSGFMFQVDNSERMRINSSGSVGIGTTSPQSRLNVSGGNLTVDNPSSVTLRLNATNTSNPTVIVQAEQQGVVSPPMGQLRWDRNPGAVGMQLNYYNGTILNALKLDGSNFIVINNGSERMRIGSAGQIGIGGANYGTSGQVLTSNGSSSAPSWQTPTGGGAGVTGVTAGSYMTGGGTSGTVTLNANASTSATANTLAARTTSGDIYARLLRATYSDQSTISGAIAFRVNNGSDNYTRYCSDPTAIRTFIGAGNYNDIRSLGAPAFTNGANPNITTAQVMSEIESDGGFDSYSSVFKTTWNYAGNYNLTDAGDFTETAGSSWITWTDNSSDSTRGNITALAIAPNTGGSAGGVFIYNDQGPTYSPGWRQVWTSTTDGSGSGLDADKLDGLHSSDFVAVTGDTMTGGLTVPNVTLADGIYHQGDSNNYFQFATDTQKFITSGVERMRINSSGNVGIGTTNPSQKLVAVGGIRSQFNSGDYSQLESNGSGGVIKAVSNGSTKVLFRSYGDSYTLNDFGIGTSVPQARLSVENTTSATSSGIVRLKSLTASNGPFIRVVDFVRSNNSTRGYIAMNPYSVQYNATSDYRLKRNVTPMENSIDRIKLLKPSRFNWVEGPDDYVVDGFIAHEVQDVVHDAVSGEKDAVDKNNEPSYQGIDQSKLVPLLTAALQDAITKIENLETRIQTLENN